MIYHVKNKPDKKLSDFIKDWQKSINWDNRENYSIVNLGVILTHLYGLIVYPKIVFHNQIPTIKIDHINKIEWGNFKFLSFPSYISKKDKGLLGVESITNENEMTLEFLIRKIRNAISHARITIYENMDYDFEDEDGTKIHFNILGLQTFTKKFRECYLSGKWE